MSNIRPLSDRIVVKAKENETTTQGGIVLPDNVDKKKPMEGEVIAIGKGKFIDGKHQPLEVKIGDKVLFGQYAGTNVKLNEKEFLILREEDIMGVVE